MGLTFDLYTHTDTANHLECHPADVPAPLGDRFVYKDVQRQWYDPVAKEFLADRYLEGECPYCGSADARVGISVTAVVASTTRWNSKDRAPKSAAPQRWKSRETEHFFLDWQR
jgi:methionyl-tRNA synthetase